MFQHNFIPPCIVNYYVANRKSGLDIGYVPAVLHAFFRLSGQFGPLQLIFHWPEGPVDLKKKVQNSEGNVNSYIFFRYIYRPNVQKCATSRVKS